MGFSRRAIGIPLFFHLIRKVFRSYIGDRMTAGSIAGQEPDRHKAVAFGTASR